LAIGVPLVGHAGLVIPATNHPVPRLNGGQAGLDCAHDPVYRTDPFGRDVDISQCLTDHHWMRVGVVQTGCGSAAAKVDNFSAGAARRTSVFIRADVHDATSPNCNRACGGVHRINCNYVAVDQDNIS
jgi:hypothetical protein